MVPGQAFGVRHLVCGFRPLDYVRKCPELTAGQKLLLDLLFRLASKTGKCFASAKWLSEELGRSLAQVKRDLLIVQAFGFIRNERRGPRGRKASEWTFPFHVLYRDGVPASDVQLPASFLEPLKVSSVTPLDGSAKVSYSAVKVSFSSRKGVTGDTPSVELKNGRGKPRRLNASSSSFESVSDLEVSVAGNGKEVGPTFTPPQPSEPEAAKPLSLNADDEKITAATAPKPERARTLKAPDEFGARLKERHSDLIAAGTFDPEQVLADVKADLGNTPLSAFLEADAKATTNPAKLANPHGHYRQLARKTARRENTVPCLRRADSLQADMAAAARKFEADAKARALAKYPCCAGTGHSPDDNAYCACACGDLLRQCDKRAAEAAAPIEAAG